MAGSRRASTQIGCASRSWARTVFDGANGGPQPFDKEAVSGRRWTPPETIIRLDLGLGDGRGEAFGCDLTEEYVRENSEYST